MLRYSRWRSRSLERRYEVDPATKIQLHELSQSARTVCRRYRLELEGLGHCCSKTMRVA